MPFIHALPIAFVGFSAIITVATLVGIAIEALQRRAELRAAARLVARTHHARTHFGGGR